MSEQPGYTAIAERARAWWQTLQPREDDGGQRDDRTPGGKGDRAALARLRRAATPAEAMVEEATLDLFRRLGLDSSDCQRLPRVAVIAMVLAHVRADAPPGADGYRPRAARAVGRVSLDDAESAVMKPLRFRRLLACREDEDLAREMRRLVALADRQINVGDLAAALFFWGDRVRTRWAFEYYAAGSGAPRDAHPVEPATEVTPA